MVQLTRVSTKGQVVIPRQIRKELGLQAGSPLMISRVEDAVVMKKVPLPPLEREFRRLAAAGSRHARRLGIRSDEDIVRRIHEHRKKVSGGV